MATETTDPRRRTTAEKPTLRQAIRSERYVLMAILGMSQIVLDDIVAILPTWEYFTVNLHRDVYCRVLELHRAGTFVDFDTVAPSIEGDTYTVGDLAGILTANFSAADFFPDYQAKERAIGHARIVAETYHRQLIADTVDSGKITDLSEYIEAMHRKGLDKTINIHQLVQDALARLDLPEVAQIPYPYGLFNTFVGGIDPGSYIVIAARPSTGKSVMLQDIAVAAVKAQKRVLFISAEMPQAMLEHRLLCATLGRNMTEARKLRSPDDYAALVAEGLAQIDQLSMDIIFTNRVATIEKRLKDHPYDLVVVDYLQLLEPKRRSYRGDYERVTSVSAELVAMARSFNAAVVVAAQFNRDSNDKQPSMAEIKGSGQIEQDADLIFSLWRNFGDMAPVGTRKVRVDLLKNRNGMVWRNSNVRQFALLLEEGIYRFRGIAPS